MKKMILFLIVVMLTLAAGTSVRAQWTEETPDSSKSASQSDSSAFTFYGRLQTLGILQNLKDNFRDNTRIYLYLKQARLGGKATYKNIDFDLQLAFGGEEEVKAPSPGVDLSLLDLSADIRLSKCLGIKVGQFKVPYGRENLTDEGYLQFTDLSVQYAGFKLGRDVGIALHSNSGTFTSTIGVFTAGGRDVPIRYIPIDLGFPMIVARIGLNDGLDENLFGVKQNLVESTSGYAFFINALYTKDSKVGHSTALNVKLGDKSLLVNPNWNPYIAKAPLGKSELWQIGADAAFRISGKEKGLSAEAEVNYGSFKNGYGSLLIAGARAQGAFYANPFEIGFRYSFLRPDENFGVTNSTGTVFQIVDNKLIQEITAAVSYYLHGNRLKLTAEVPIGINVPVVTESNLGAYPLMQQQDQTTVIAQPNSKIERQTIFEARLQLQVILF